MSVDIYIYAERRQDTGWALYSPGGRGEDGPLALEDIQPVYQTKRREGDYELGRTLLDASSTPLGDGSRRIFPRGLPDDISSELENLVYDREKMKWMCNDPSWLLLRELLEIPWAGRGSRTTGLVDAMQYRVFKQMGRPEHFASSKTSEIFSAGPRTGLFGRLRLLFSGLLPEPIPRSLITNAEMEQLIEGGKLTTGALTQITCKNSYPEFCEVFAQQTVPLLQTLGGPDDVRIVFWF